MSKFSWFGCARKGHLRLVKVSPSKIICRKNHLVKSQPFMLSATHLRIRHDGLGLIRVSALIPAGIHGRRYVEVSLARDDRVVGVSGRAIERSVDHPVRTTGYGAAVYVVAGGIRRDVPGEVDGV